MSGERFETCGPLWLWQAERGRWHFVTISGATARAVHNSSVISRLELGLPRKRGWGAVKVEAQIGETVWRTSLFPQDKGAEYLLPIKAAVRKAEGLVAGDDLAFAVTLL